MSADSKLGQFDLVYCVFRYHKNAYIAVPSAELYMGCLFTAATFYTVRRVAKAREEARWAPPRPLLGLVYGEAISSMWSGHQPGIHTIRSALIESPMLHADFTVVCFLL